MTSISGISLRCRRASEKVATSRPEVAMIRAGFLPPHHAPIAIAAPSPSFPTPTYLESGKPTAKLMPASFSPWTTSCAFAISMSLLSFELRSCFNHLTNSQFSVDFFLQTKIKQARHRKRFLQLLSLRISFEILASILLGNHAVSTKTLLGKQISLSRRIAANAPRTPYKDLFFCELYVIPASD